MPTDQVRGLKARESSPAKTRGCSACLNLNTGRLAARINRFEASSDHRHDVHIPVDVNLVQKPVRVPFRVWVLQHLN
jgi:hypothetical protein